MTDATINGSLGAPLKEVQGKWGWFVALGIGRLVGAVIAGLNLFAATLVSILYIAAMMLAGGVIQFIHAFVVYGWSRKAFYVLSGLLYAVAGAIAIYDPVLSAVSVSLVLGMVLIAAGAARIASVIRAGQEPGRGWIVASGIITMLVGALVVLVWPAIGLWLLGAMLTVDLLFQGASFIGFGMALRVRNGRFRKPTNVPDATPSQNTGADALA